MQRASLPEAAEPAPAQLGAVPRALAFLGPDFTMFVFFAGIFLALGIVYGAHFHVAGEGSILIAGGVMAGLVGLRFAWRAPSIVRGDEGERGRFVTAALRILRDWGPLVLLTVVFENLHAYTGLIRKVPIDDQLYHLDLAVFGVEPSAWIGRHAIPILTDWFAFAYGLYFILPMILACMLSWRGRRLDFRELATALVIHMCLGFLGFILFPAGPPRFYQPLVHGGFQPPHLTSFLGLWEWSQGTWDTVNPNPTHSSFPSMHCAVAMLTLLYAHRFGDAVFPKRPRLFFWICLPLVVSLWCSTVYLRHHWVPDCVAGWLLGVFCYVITPPLRRWWPGAVRAASV